MSRIKVLVVDDSAFMRKAITDILSSSPEIEVIGKAKNGQEACEKVIELKPDVVTLDIEMPVLDGLQTLGYIMSECPTPVIMLSAAESKHADVTMKAFEYGAVDFILKPSGNISLDVNKIKDEMVKKVKAAAKVETHKLGFIQNKEDDSGISRMECVREGGKKPKDSDVEIDRAEEQKIEPDKKSKFKKIVIIGTSTGGPRALQQVIPLLPPYFNAPVLVVQHMPAGFTKSLAERLDSQSSIKVREAVDGDIVRPGIVLIAPGDYHMTVREEEINGKTKEVIALIKGEKVQGVRPSVDVLLNSVAPIYGAHSVGVILTGMGSDGTDGIRRLKSAGGRVIAEDESTCVVFGMPRSIIEQHLADYVLPINKIAESIAQIT
ncbi:Chemotaxis response regulator protein-glutamate methylesterase/glutamine deamidase [uncultured archaeon]|nr:Chemotaxis response regulator protein-glutamate methylesterase/glutamine deamidase [uncultured archaeon]